MNLKSYSNTFLIDKVSTYLPTKRVLHSKRVSEIATQLCDQFGGDRGTVNQAALLHDIAKYLNPELLKNKVEDIDFLESVFKLYPKVWHAFIANEVLRFEKIDVNNNVLDAIYFHTTGKDDMRLETQIVFVADFLDFSSDSDLMRFIQKEAFLNLDCAVFLISSFTLFKCLRSADLIHPYTLECRNFYANRLQVEKKHQLCDTMMSFLK